MAGQEDDKFGRLRRLQWLSELVEQAAREADAHCRLEYELRRREPDERPDAHRHRRAA